MYIVVLQYSLKDNYFIYLQILTANLSTYTPNFHMHEYTFWKAFEQATSVLWKSCFLDWSTEAEEEEPTSGNNIAGNEKSILCEEIKEISAHYFVVITE